MKKLTALLLVLAMLLPACGSAGDDAENTTPAAQSSSLMTALTTTAEPTLSTETLPPAVTSDEKPETTVPSPTTSVPAVSDAPETTVSPDQTDAPETTVAPETTKKPETNAPHAHGYSAWKTVKAAACEEKGSEERTCACGEKETRTVAAKGHSYGSWKTVKAATCEGTGSRERTCACGKKETGTVAAKGHSYSLWSLTQFATVESTGEEERTCDACDKLEKRTVAKLTPSLDSLFPIDNAARVTLVSSTAEGFTNGEDADSLFDSAPYTKLCTDTIGYTIEWKLDEASKIYGYSIMTANDTQQYDRRPTAWTLEASRDGSSWTTVSTVNNANLPKQNYTEAMFPIDAASYRYFRFTLKAPNGMTQFSEITLYTNEVPETPAFKNKRSATELRESENTVAGLGYVRRIIDDYYNRDTHRVGEQPGQTGATTLWPATSFLEAVAEAYRACPDDPYIYSTYVDLLNNGIPGVYRVADTITSTTGSYDVVYYNAVAYSKGDYYYDDDAWVCLQYLNAYDLLGDERYLELAEESLEFFWTGWDDEFGGGIYWDKRYYCKNTCADGPIAIAYLRAYELTGKQDYLDKGIRIYDWLRDVMLDNNLYIDNIGFKNTNDKIDYNTIETNPWKAAYNQGTPLAAGALLYRITGEKKYLDETTAVWNATVNHMFRGSGSNTTMNGNPIYRAWCVGWLVRGFEMYYEVDGAKKTTAMDKLLSVLEDERGTVNYQNRTGYYDPYFCTGDYANESMTQILQTAGVACTFLLAGHYELSK